MDAELKAKWIEALRSGEFAQGEGKLHDPKADTYCCLGVLCKIKGAIFEAAEGFDDDGDHYDFKHVPILDGEILSCREDEELSASFAGRLGIDQAVLITMNDGHRAKNHPDHKPRHSFAEIADYIEKNL